MKEEMMVIPLRVPKEVGRAWKLEAVKQDKSVQRWLLDRLQESPKPSATASKRVKVESSVVGGSEVPVPVPNPPSPAVERNKAIASISGDQSLADKMAPVKKCAKC